MIKFYFMNYAFAKLVVAWLYLLTRTYVVDAVYYAKIDTLENSLNSKLNNFVDFYL